MKGTSILKPRRIFAGSLLVLFVALFLALAINPVSAQEPVNYCEPSRTVKDELKQLPRWQSDETSYDAFQERYRAALENLARKYPTEVHLRKLLADARRSDRASDREALTREYRGLMEKDPNDPVAAYLYAKILIGTHTTEAIAVLEKLAAQAPEFPWTYLELGSIYKYPAFRDTTKSHDNLKKWTAKCPDSLNGVRTLAASGDPDLMRDALRRIRARLASTTAPLGPDDLHYYPDAWSLEFKLRPIPEHSQVRQQIAGELKRLRAQNPATVEWLGILQEGYKTTEDEAGRRWAEDEVLRLFPKSSEARGVLRGRWDAEHPRPKQDEASEKRQAYNQALVKATDEWLKQWPDDVSLLSARYFAFDEIDNARTSEIEAAAEAFLKALALENRNVYYIPPAEVMVAHTYAAHKFATERIPDLVRKGLLAMEQQEKRDTFSDLFPREDGDDNSNLKYTRWYAWPILAEAYARLKETAKARITLARMAEALKAEKPPEDAKQSRKMGYQSHQAAYWQTVAEVAEADNRKLDALTAYQTALSFRGKPNGGAATSKKDELTESAERLWKELGGTDEGWQAYLARNESARSAAAVETATWDERKQKLPAFTLTDMQGKKWQLADLKGKVAFINFWATWCGPCQQELPYVQKLHDRMKGRQDVVVLTMNTDEELRLVEPFMKQNKYSFTVIPAAGYASSLNINSIPRNWVVGADGIVQFEGIGFGGEGNDWVTKATTTIEKAKGGGDAKIQK